uniref:Reverse transcriptase domain-containing protein n=1 Tax=Callorhinchus milii TaxID=7868 RepID=A0A4W3IXB0_CALMI
QSSLDTGVVPEDWSSQCDSPVQKGTEGKPGNYRPVSLTSVVGKLLETIIRDRINLHLEEYGLIRDSQHGFVKGRSCLTSLLEFFDEVTERLGKGSGVDVVYKDFQKAFDKVPHERLVRKIEAHGIKGTVAARIQSWLGDRKQRVVVNGCFSDWREVYSGVPQGLVLGPLLFLIYINDLDLGIPSTISKFADDTKLGRVVNSEKDSSQLQEHIDRMVKWADTWQMNFNVEKCEVMHFVRKNEGRQYRLVIQS